jgi:hypothetical protein
MEAIKILSEMPKSGHHRLMVKTPPLPDLSGLTHAQKDELILALFEVSCQ